MYVNFYMFRDRYVCLYVDLNKFFNLGIDRDVFIYRFIFIDIVSVVIIFIYIK